MINLVTFDLDGTIIDDEWAHNRAKTEIAMSIGAGRDLDLYDYTGRSNRKFWAHVYEKYHLKNTISIETLVSLQFEKVLQYVRQVNQPESKGLTETLKYLKSNGFTVAVASGSDESFVDGLLGYLGIAEYFDVKITKNHVSRVKPDPDVYLASQKLAGIESAFSIGVEDSEPGCQALKSAGMISVGYTNEGKNPQVLLSADYIIPEMTFLIPILEKLP